MHSRQHAHIVESLAVLDLGNAAVCMHKCVEYGRRDFFFFLYTSVFYFHNHKAKIGLR